MVLSAPTLPRTEGSRFLYQRISSLLKSQHISFNFGSGFCYVVNGEENEKTYFPSTLRSVHVLHRDCCSCRLFLFSLRLRPRYEELENLHE